MQVRVITGVGMGLVAAGLMIMFFLQDNPDPTPESGNADRENVLDLPAPDKDGPGAPDAESFLREYNAAYKDLWTGAEGGKWNAQSNITETNTRASIVADGALADYVGSRSVINKLKQFRNRMDLNDLQDRQVEQAWQQAAHYPGTIPDVVDRLIATQAVAIDSLYGATFVLERPGEPARVLTPNDISGLLASSRDLEERKAVWNCSKQVGVTLKEPLVELQGLRNAVAREMGYSSFFGLEVADYGMTSDQMIALMDDLIAGMMPLYRQLHCWVKHELAERYEQAVPVRIPAHWLGNRWGQSWPGLVESADLDGMFTEVQPQWIIEQAEKFYVSMGFGALPVTFWGRSDLFALPAGADRKKNTHASAWHIDLDQDVRSLMSVEADFDWFQTTHHELGHVYYYLAYSRPEVPVILRRGANRAFHEGIGTLIELAASQMPYLVDMGLMTPADAPDSIQWLLSQALTGPVVFIPFACGTMTHFEYDLYEQDLPAHEFNARWWAYAGMYQGIEPPTARGEQFCDAATKTHIIDDPAQYYDYAVSNVILHQLHRFICREILEQDVRSASYYGSAPVGRYLNSILELGATRDWAQVIRQATGEDLSSEAMLEYFAPLQVWLEEQNKGRNPDF